ncbi:MAG: glycosyltransferase family 4 protein [Gemmatimonadota bacterium]|nr:glycosyltransferase family 4 protein [Gemmatimonadota bacterium]
MNGLRFAFLTTFYPPYNFGGDGIGIQRLARGLVRHGHHVTVIHDADAYHMLNGGPPGGRPTPEDGVEVVALRSSAGALSCLLTQQTGRPVVHGARIRTLLREGRYDVVNFHNASLIGGPGLLEYGEGALRLYMAHEHWLVCPTHVLWRHGRERCTERQCIRCQLHYKRPPQLWRATGALERALDHVDAFIAVSDFSRDKHREFGFPKDMEVLNYFLPDPEPGPDPVQGSSPHERPYFLFVGRLERIKGLDDVIPLFERYPDADLVIAGDGEYGATLRDLAADNPRVRFLGRLDHEALERYYRHAVALIVPSVCFETFGIIIIESFKYRTPVLARRLGPFPEILTRSGGGELFDSEDELAAAMARLQQDPGRRRQLGDAGYQAYLTHWVESAAIPRYLDIVRRTAARTGHPSIERALEAEG